MATAKAAQAKERQAGSYPPSASISSDEAGHQQQPDHGQDVGDVPQAGLVDGRSAQLRDGPRRAAEAGTPVIRPPADAGDSASSARRLPGSGTAAPTPSAAAARPPGRRPRCRPPSPRPYGRRPSPLAAGCVQQHLAVGLGRLVRGAARTSPSSPSSTDSTSTSHGLARAAPRRAARSAPRRAARRARAARRRRRRSSLSSYAGGLGAVLVGVPEDADRRPAAPR